MHFTCKKCSTRFPLPDRVRGAQQIFFLKCSVCFSLFALRGGKIALVPDPSRISAAENNLILLEVETSPEREELNFDLFDDAEPAPAPPKAVSAVHSMPMATSPAPVLQGETSAGVIELSVSSEIKAAPPTVAKHADAPSDRTVAKAIKKGESVRPTWSIEELREFAKTYRIIAGLSCCVLLVALYLGGFLVLQLAFPKGLSFRASLFSLAALFPGQQSSRMIQTLDSFSFENVFMRRLHPYAGDAVLLVQGTAIARTSAENPPRVVVELYSAKDKLVAVQPLSYGKPDTSTWMTAATAKELTAFSQQQQKSQKVHDDAAELSFFAPFYGVKPGEYFVLFKLDEMASSAQ